MKSLLVTIAALIFVGCGNSELDDQLRDAASNGNIEDIERLLDAGANINAQGEGKYYFDGTPLNNASMEGHDEIVKLLISKGADLNANNIGYTPLHSAIHSYNNGPHKKIIEILIESGANINAKTKNGFTALDSAILVERRKKLGNEISKLLLSKGAKSGAKSSLLVAATLGDAQSIKELIDGEADIHKITSGSETLLHVAAKNNHKNIVELLLDNGSSINAVDEQGRTPLFKAVSGRHKEIVELLIAKGADINTDTGLHRLAVFSSSRNLSELEQKQKKESDSEKIEIAKLLISNGVDVNRIISGDTALHIAAQNGNEEMAKLLIRSGSNINESNKGSQTPIHKAAFEGRDKIVNLLIQNGANVNTVIQSSGSFNGMTPADLALKNNKIKTVALLRRYGGVTEKELIILKTKKQKTKLQNQLLIEAIKNRDINTVKSRINEGEDVNSVDKNGMLPLQIATVFGHFQIVEFLIEKGADVNGTDVKLGQTALYMAAFSNRKNIAEKLINAGANVDAKIPRGDTPLHAAIMAGNHDLVEFLISKGANVDAKIMFGVAKGCTPLDMATWINNPNRKNEIINLLRKHNAKTGVNLESLIEDSPLSKLDEDNLDDLIGVDQDGDGFDAYDEKITGHSDNDSADKPTQGEVDAAQSEIDKAEN